MSTCFPLRSRSRNASCSVEVPQIDSAHQSNSDHEPLGLRAHAGNTSFLGGQKIMLNSLDDPNRLCDLRASMTGKIFRFFSGKNHKRGPDRSRADQGRKVLEPKGRASLEEQRSSDEHDRQGSTEEGDSWPSTGSREWSDDLSVAATAADITRAHATAEMHQAIRAQATALDLIRLTMDEVPESFEATNAPDAREARQWIADFGKALCSCIQPPYPGSPSLVTDTTTNTSGGSATAAVATGSSRTAAAVAHFAENCAVRLGYLRQQRACSRQAGVLMRDGLAAIPEDAMWANNHADTCSSLGAGTTVEVESDSGGVIPEEYGETSREGSDISTER